MRRYAGAALTGLLLAVALWFVLSPAPVVRSVPAPLPAPAPPRQLADRPPVPRPVRPPPPVATESSETIDILGFIADQAGLGQVACRLPEGVDAASGPGLLRPRVADGWLFALVATPEGQAPLRATGRGVVAHVQWYDAVPGVRGDCVTEPPRTPVEHRVRVLLDGSAFERRDAHRLEATGCEGAGVPDADGALVVRSFPGSPCTLQVADRKTGATGDLLLDAEAAGRFDLHLDVIDPALAGRSRRDVHLDGLQAQLDDAEAWLAVLDETLANAPPPAQPALEAERAKAVEGIEALERLIDGAP